MWNGDAANNGDIDDGASDSGMSENIDDDDEASDDDGPLNMDVVQHVLNQQLEHHHYHNFIHHRFEPDDETLSLDSGGDFNETKDSFHVYANPEPLESKAAQEIEWNDVDHIIADPTIKVEGITRDWISFDDVVRKFHIYLNLKSLYRRLVYPRSRTSFFRICHRSENTNLPTNLNICLTS